MFRRTFQSLRIPRPVVDEGRLGAVLMKLGVDLSIGNRRTVYKCVDGGSEDDRSGEQRSSVIVDPMSDFAPFFTPHFSFERGRLARLGAVTIRMELTRIIHRSLLWRKTIATSNVVNQTLACYHNAVAMQYLAEQLGLMELPSSSSAVSASDDRKLSELERTQRAITALRETPVAPSQDDLDETAITHREHAGDGSRSLWGQQLEHLIGAIRLHFGEDSARLAIRRLWRFEANEDGTVKVAIHAAQFLSEVASTQPAGCLAQAILSAQHIRFSFSTRHFPVKSDGRSGHAHHGGHASGVRESSANSASAAPPVAANGDKSAATSDGAVANWSGGGADDGESAVALVRRSLGLSTDLASTIPQLGGAPADVSPSEVLTSLAAGPGLVDLVAKFKRAHGGAAEGAASDGWLAKPEASPWAAHKVRFASISTGDAYLADVLGPKEPEQGRTVSTANASETQQDDPSFFGLFTNKDGVAVETFGQSAADYVRSFRRQGAGSGAGMQRAFEVSLLTRDPTAKSEVVAARAVSPRYSLARNAAAAAYLDGVLLDLLRLASAAQE